MVFYKICFDICTWHTKFIYIYKYSAVKKERRPTMLYEDVIVWICWLGVVRCFILVLYSYNLISWWWNPSLVFFHLFSIILLAKSKISKSISLFLSHIGPKWFLLIRFQDFKSNISLKQRDEIFYFFACWYWKLRVDRKILWWVW